MDVTSSLLEILIIGALMGMLGQGVRAVAGLKSMSDDAKALNLSPNDLFRASRLITSFLIGALIGLASAVAYFLKNSGIPTSPGPDWPTLLPMWAATAYAGTDFLESFISQYLSPGASGSTVQKLAAAAIVKPLAQLPVAAVLKPQAQQPAAGIPYDQAEKIVMNVLKAGPQVNDKTSLSGNLGYANEESLYILAGQINDVIVPKGYYIDNSQISNWSTVGDVVKNVENAKRVGSQP